VAFYFREGRVRSVWACGVGLVAFGWARGMVECVCGAQDGVLVEKDQREREKGLLQGFL
jgi:hypothetical protein